MADLARRVGLTADQVEALATAGAFDRFGVSRREALWGAGAAATARPGQLDVAVFDETAPAAAAGDDRARAAHRRHVGHRRHAATSTPPR